MINRQKSFIRFTFTFVEGAFVGGQRSYELFVDPGTKERVRCGLCWSCLGWSWSQRVWVWRFSVCRWNANNTRRTHIRDIIPVRNWKVCVSWRWGSVSWLYMYILFIYSHDVDQDIFHCFHPGVQAIAIAVVVGDTVEMNRRGLARVKEAGGLTTTHDLRKMD